MKKLIATVLLMSLAIVARSAVPGIITYQGRVTSHGTNFTGLGQFKFSLVQTGALTVTWWSQDGFSTPNSIVSVPVTNGLFNVALGDTGITGMLNAIPASVFDNTNTRLRIWFNDGTTGFAQLAPDQRLTSVGYAMRAANVADGAITGNQIAPGAITNIHLANNSVSGGKITDPLTLQTLNLGSINWDGTLNVYAQPEGGGGIGLPTGDLRARLSGLHTNGMLELFGETGFTAVRAFSTSLGGALRLQDDAGSSAVTMGALADGGFLSVWRPGGNLGVALNGGDIADVGGEVTLYHSDAGGFSTVGIFLDGNSTASGGEISVRDFNGVETIELLGNTSSGQGSLLTMRNGLGGITVSIDADASGRGSAFTLYNGTNDIGIYLDGNSGGAGLIEVRNNLGSTRATLDGQGTGSGGELVLKDENATTTVFLAGAQSSSTGGRLEMSQADGALTVILDAEVGTGGGGYLQLRNGAGTGTITLDSDFNGEGRITTQVLEITGGSDLSENFDIQSPHAKPGMLVRIDPAHPGELAVSDRAYDRTVAGVVSGAGGVKPGMLMGQRNSKADGKHPVALTGRVYCLVDASVGAIEPGDLITTSDTLGHGMKVTDHARAQGAIIGKAMTGLARGQGLVLVLVSLQ